MAKSGDPGTLVVRRFERQSLCLRSEIRPAGSMSGVVRLSRASGQRTGGVPATLFDLSEGGMGIRTGVFFPKRSELLALVLDKSGREIAELPCVVQRVTMVGRQPEYELGLSFAAPAEALASRLKAVLDAAAQAGGGEGAGA